MRWRNALDILLTVIIVVLTFLLLFYPIPVKFIISKFAARCTYEPSVRAVMRENYTFYTNGDKHAVTTTTTTNDIVDAATAVEEQERQRRRRRLLVWFHGGAFLFSDRRATHSMLNRLHDSVEKDGFDILVFDYPVRFRSTLRETMLAINATLTPFIGRYEEFYAGGMSSGVLLMGAFANKERDARVSAEIRVPRIGVRFRAMISICGLFDTRFDSALLNALFRLYVSRGSPGVSRDYTCYGLGVPFLALTAEHDCLYSQTRRFVTTESAEYHVFRNTSLPHIFALFENLRESDECVARMSAFLRKHVSPNSNDNDVVDIPIKMM